MPGKSPRNIVITGFMGTGKTTVARIAAGRLGLELVSTDALIEARAGQSIPEIFAQQGEVAFRSLEAIICREVATRPDVVIDTGGGALLNPTTRAAFTESGLVICLTCAPGEIMRRLSGDSSRPLLAGDARARIAALLAERAPVYDALPHHVDTTRLSPEQAADEVIALWKQHTSR
jgi:shikimate kinase